MANGIRRPRQSRIGLDPQEEKRAGVLPFPKRAATKPPMARTPPTPAMKATGKPAVRAKPAMRGMDPAGRRMPDEDRYPRSTAAYGMAHGGTVVDGYEYEGGINGIKMAANRKSTPSKQHMKRNPVHKKIHGISPKPFKKLKKVAKKGSSTPSSKSRKINPIFKTKKAARGGKIK